MIERGLCFVTHLGRRVRAHGPRRCHPFCRLNRGTWKAEGECDMAMVDYRQIWCPDSDEFFSFLKTVHFYLKKNNRRFSNVLFWTCIGLERRYL